MARHHVFTIIADVRDDAAEASLRRILGALPGDTFADLEMLHFTSFVVFSRKDLRERDKSILVFECNIDGPIAAFLDRAIDRPVIDEIYRFCDEYPIDGTQAEKRDFLYGKVRIPELYHIGTPYQSVDSIQQDRQLRARLDEAIHGLLIPTLREHLSATPAGQREYWTPDALRPWLAWLVAVAGTALAVWLAVLTRPLALPRWVAWPLMAVYAFIAAASVIGGYKAWVTTVPELRERVRPWIRWAVAAVMWAAVVMFVWPRDQRWALILAAGFVVVTAYNISAAVRRRTSERLMAVRANTVDPSLAAVWASLKRLAAAVDDGPAWWEPIWNARWWIVPVALLYGVVWLTATSTVTFVATIAAIFLAKAWWLTTLVGWPASGKTGPHDRKRIWLFRLALPTAAAAAFGLLQILGSPTSLLAGLLIGLLIAMWTVPLPSPEPADHSPYAGKVRDVMRQEDMDVQNHMSAVVTLRSDRFYRVPVLKSFLFALNRLFYRSIAPDVYRGKLFGVPTVHFAQWIVLDRRNYLFLSNYDHSWDSYLDDFGQTLETGIQKIWGQGERNPGTKDLGRFKNFARTTMTTHSFWYRAYPGLTLRQAWNNRNVRRELLRGSNDEESMAAALRRLGQSPKTLADIGHSYVN